MANEYQVGAVYVQVLDETPAAAQIGAAYLQVLTSLAADPNIQIGGLYAEVLTSISSNPEAQVAGAFLEVLAKLPPTTPELEFSVVNVDESEVFPFGVARRPVFDLVVDSDLEVLAFRVYVPPPQTQIDAPVEWNPFRPDVPEHIASNDPQLYDYLREQAELIREQHNNAQAGDSTFPWQLVTSTGAQQAHTLGSMSRFIHPDYGLMAGRYVRFSKHWLPVSHPFVGHDETQGDWVASNAGKADSFRVIGLSGAFVKDPSESYGWVLTQGRAPFGIELNSESRPGLMQSFTWDPLTGRGLVGPGPQVGVILANGPFNEVLDEGGEPFAPRRWSIPAGLWTVDVQGVTPEYIRDTASLVTSALDARVTALESAEPETLDFTAAINSLNGDVLGLQRGLSAEIQARQLADNSLSARIRSIQDGLTEMASDTSLSGLSVRLGNVESETETIKTSVVEAAVADNKRFQSLETWRKSAITQIDGLVVAVQALSDPMAIGIGIDPIAGLDSLTVQDALAELKTDFDTPAAVTVSYPTLNAPWSNIGGIWRSTVVYRTKDNIVYVEGLISAPPGSPTANVNLFVIAPGFRPSKNLIFPVNMQHADGTQATGRIDISSDGTVVIRNGATGYMSLTGIGYSTDAI